MLFLCIDVALPTITKIDVKHQFAYNAISSRYYEILKN